MDFGEFKHESEEDEQLAQASEEAQFSEEGNPRDDPEVSGDSCADDDLASQASEQDSDHPDQSEEEDAFSQQRSTSPFGPSELPDALSGTIQGQ
jgi:hypothetical protein